MLPSIDRRVFLGAATSTVLLAACGQTQSEEPFDTPPPGFTSARAEVNGTNLHYVRGGEGPAVLLIHGMPEDWTEYKAIMPRLAQRFTVVAIDLPGIGQSGPASNGYEAASLAGDIHAMARSIGLERPYVVGHDLGGIVTYAYVRRFPDSLRGAMILDVPVPGVGGWEESTDDLWHLGFINAPGQLAEKLITGRQEHYFAEDFAGARFTPAQRDHYVRIYGEPQLHAAFEIYRGFARDGEFNAAQTAPNNVPLFIAVGEKSPFNAYLETFIEGYRAKGMTDVQGTRIPDAGHYVVADNPDLVASLIERHAVT